MDVNEFFREITLRLCRNLEIEEGLRSCIEYLACHMPADKIYLQRYDRDFKAMRYVACATVEKGEKMDVRIPLVDVDLEEMRRQREIVREGKLPPVLIVNRHNEGSLNNISVMPRVGLLRSSAP